MELTGVFAQIFEAFWGKEDAIEKHDVGDGKSYEIINLSGYRTAINHNFDILLVREGYKIAYDAIAKRIDENPDKVAVYMVTGQPGIGGLC